jgi:acetyl-CoA carboxylase carboxyltransferase component
MVSAGERIDALINPESPFLELSRRAAFETYGEEAVLSARIVTNIERVLHKECAIVVYTLLS